MLAGPLLLPLPPAIGRRHAGSDNAHQEDARDGDEYDEGSLGIVVVFMFRFLF